MSVVERQKSKPSAEDKVVANPNSESSNVNGNDNDISHSRSSSSSSIVASYLPSIPRSMLKIWPNMASPSIGPFGGGDLTPRAGPNGQERSNPFNDRTPALSSPSISVGSNTPTKPGHYHHLLSVRGPGTPGGGSLLTPGPRLSSANSEAAPLNSPLVTSPGGRPALPTTQVSLFNAPQFNMKEPPAAKMKSKNVPVQTAPTATSNGSSTATGGSPPTGPSRGLLHITLVEARNLIAKSPYSKPYVVVQYDQNEFVGSDPIHTSNGNGTTAANGVASTSSALDALNAIGSRASSLGKSTAPSSPHPSNTSDNDSYFDAGRVASHPTWKIDVSFDVTSGDSPIQFNLYDRWMDQHTFLGTCVAKPALVNDQKTDKWYKLKPVEDEVVSGDLRVQIRFEGHKVRYTLTPRDFEFLKLIGRGTFGKVFQVRKKDTHRIYAMKILSKKEIIAKKEVAHTIGERTILQRSVDSPFLVGLKFSFQTDSDLYLVTDFKCGGELFWHLQKETRFSEERARFYIAELVLALEHLHKHNIVYRDLKPENILLDATGHIALCDFGLSKANLPTDELTKTFCGTTEYLAPEVLLDEHGYSKLVDFWSLGVLLFEMCCGWSPFYAEDTQQMYKNICFGKIRFPKGVIGEEGKQFVKGLLNRNPKHRLGAQRDAAELKEHAFFASIDWAALELKQVTPPFKPVVESDDSTANFDPEFTSADVHEVGGNAVNDLDELDEEDPSEDWLQSASASGQHTPNGPLGSDRLGPLSPFSPHGDHAHTPGSASAPHPTPVRPQPQGIQINTKTKSKKQALGTPLTSSVQENFRGFTFSGGESVVTPNGVMSARAAFVHSVQGQQPEEDAEDVSESEFDDGGGAPLGRFSKRRGTDDMDH